MTQSFYLRFSDKKLIVNTSINYMTVLVKEYLKDMYHQLPVFGKDNNNTHKNQYFETYNRHKDDEKLINLHDIDFKNILDPYRKIRIYRYKKYFLDEESSYT